MVPIAPKDHNMCRALHIGEPGNETSTLAARCVYQGYGGGPNTQRGGRVQRVSYLQLPHPITSHLSQPPSTERTRLRTIIRAMVAMTTGVDFVSIFSPPDCKEDPGDE